MGNGVECSETGGGGEELAARKCIREINHGFLRGLHSPGYFLPVSFLPLELLPVDSGAEKGEDQHEDGDLEQSPRCAGDGLGAFGEERVASVDEFDVDPVDE